MKCPVCHEPLFTIEDLEIELDFCGECQGFWLDTGELDLLLGEHQLSEEFLSGGDLKHTEGEAKRPCPICSTMMEKQVTKGAAPIVYDLCPKKHGMWFDKGELHDILKAALSVEASPVLTWLRELFQEKEE